MDSLCKKRQLGFFTVNDETELKHFVAKKQKLDMQLKARCADQVRQKRQRDDRKKALLMLKEKHPETLH